MNFALILFLATRLLRRHVRARCRRFRETPTGGDGRSACRVRPRARGRSRDRHGGGARRAGVPRGAAAARALVDRVPEELLPGAPDRVRTALVRRGAVQDPVIVDAADARGRRFHPRQQVRLRAAPADHRAQDRRGRRPEARRRRGVPLSAEPVAGLHQAGDRRRRRRRRRTRTSASRSTASHGPFGPTAATATSKACASRRSRARTSRSTRARGARSTRSRSIRRSRRSARPRYARFPTRRTAFTIQTAAASPARCRPGTIS